MEAIHPEFLVVLLLLFQSGAAAALAEALGSTGGDDAIVWEVRGGTRTRLVPDPTGTSFVAAGDEGAKQAKKVRGGREDLAALRRQIERSWRWCTDVAVQLLLPDGYPHSVSSDYMQYSVWRGLQNVASQISGVLSTQVCIVASESIEMPLSPC